MSLKKTPPKFQNGMSYKTWKNRIDMWELVTAIEKKGQSNCCFVRIT